MENRLAEAARILCSGKARQMMKLVASLLSVAAMLAAQPNLMPWPAKISQGQGSLAIDQTFRVALTGYHEPRLRAAAGRLIARLSLQTGMPLSATLAVDASQATLAIQCDGASEPVQKFGEDESYRLEVGVKQAKLSAANPLGILRGMETFLQLVNAGPQSYTAPVVTIDDQPRFPWRGLHLDVSRHFMPLEVVKRNL